AVSVIDTATNTVVATVGVGNSPLGVAITPDGARAYVTNYGSHTVSVIDIATNTVVATIGVGLNCSGGAITSDGTHAYVAHSGGFSDMLVIDTATNTVVAAVQGFVGLRTVREVAIAPATKPPAIPSFSAIPTLGTVPIVGVPVDFAVQVADPP